MYKEKNLNLDLFSEIPNSSHKEYITGIYCIRDKGNMNPTCLQSLKKARSMDGHPNRVFPEINAFIKSLENVSSRKNVFVIDPEKIIYQAKNKNEYLSYFIDIHHPSDKGHILIAEKILNKIYPDTKLSISKASQCGTYIYKSDNFSKEIND